MMAMDPEDDAVPGPIVPAGDDSEAPTGPIADEVWLPTGVPSALAWEVCDAT